MKKVSTIRWAGAGLLIGLWFLCAPIFGQDQPLTKADEASIKYKATQKLEDLNARLNLLASVNTEDNDADLLIKGSYQPGPNQLFLDGSVIIEDDIDPNHTSAGKTSDSEVDKYLKDFYLLYVKTSIEKPVIFSKQIVYNPVQRAGEPIFIKIFFTTFFKNRHKTIKEEYKPNERVVQMRVEKVNNKWVVYITRLGFPQPGEGNELVIKKKPVAQVAFAKPPVPLNLVISGPEVVYMQPDDKYTATLKFNKSWLQVIQTGSAELPVGSYARMGNVYAFDSLTNITFEKNNSRFVFHRGLNFKAFDRVMPEKAAPAKPTVTKADSVRAAQELANRTVKPGSKPLTDTTNRLAVKNKVDPNLKSETKPVTAKSAETVVKKTASQQPKTDTTKTIAFQPPPAVTPNRVEPTPESAYKVPEKEPKKTKEKPAKKEKEKPIVRVPDPPKVGPDVANGLGADARKEKARYRTAGWLQLVAGVAGLAGSYVGYSSIKKDYQDYSAKLTTLNAEYDVWQGLARQPTGARTEPLSLTGYGSPGIYGAYGGGAISLGLVVNGVRSLLKAGKIKPKTKK